MAAFSYQLPTTFLLDSIFLPNTNTNYLQPDHNNPNLITTSKFQESSSCLDDHSESDGNSLTTKHSTDSSTVSMADYNKLDSSGDQQVSQQLTPIDNKRKKTNNNSKEYSAQPKGTREGTVCKKQKVKCNGSGMREHEEKEGKAEQREEKKVPGEPAKGYIHVRARRGQATDSHSLAERVRREKISERMKILQKLVPGCDKVTGKALMLDEIINYVQSLQNQVEFLSLKLAALSPMFYDFGLDAFTIRPEGGLALPLQESDPDQRSTAFTDAAPVPQLSPHLLEAPVLLHPGHAPNVFPQAIH